MQSSAEEALLEALLAALAAAPDGMSLPRLCKRLDVRMSVLLRTLAYLGDDAIGDTSGPGWVRTFEDGERTLAQLTDAGRAMARSLADDAEPGEAHH
ncbi:hypothetical protein PQS31_03350 [Luteimonas sp BLCC-B24]|uniref:hypothetical protein n=1 Tax=Luteimonas sp. BLCC-B24 TaxID=3025317 RepID=UPI00234C38BC|nr:hypothetical protein [Luteimonas sp. BLCC-B24]MDC7805856.1 hypothetical protein [Luteimonas sp. BLCC-B24]